MSIDDKQEPTLEHEDEEQLLPVDDHVEEVSEGGRKVRRKGIYLLPNLLTTGALFSGFYAIIAGVNGAFDSAAIAIFVAMVFDGLDGRVARLANVQSAFGAQYDSLSDMVSFGVAPAIVSFSWALSTFGKVGWVVSFIYVACAALRLARFNTQADTADKRYFTGLNSPSAAALVASMIWICHDLGWVGADLSRVTAGIAMLLTGLAGIMMVTNIRYYSFKDLDLKGRVPFGVILLIIIAFVVISIDPPSVLFILTAIYALSGPVQRVIQGKPEKPEANPIQKESKA